MKIDAHQHFWHYHPERHPWITPQMSVLRRDWLPEHLRPELAAAGLDACIAVQADSSERETHFLLDLAQDNPEIAGVVGWAELTSANIGDRLEHFAQFEKLKGFRHIAQSEPDDCFLVRDDFLRGISSLEAFSFTYDILIYPRQLPAAAELVRRFPRQPFVIDHLAKPSIKTGEMEPWKTLMRKVAESDNVFCKLSGMVTEASWTDWTPADFLPYLDVVFEAFGPRRLMFGSDWPVCRLAGSYAQVKQLIAGYASSDHDQLLGLTASRFYGLTA
jgi:L-fuconolactonase